MWQKILWGILYCSLFTILTVISQVGGFILIGNLILSKLLRINGLKVYLTFAILYLSFTFLIIPPVAKSMGRLALPVFAEKGIGPVNVMTCLLNRHFVRPSLKMAVQNVASSLNRVFPRTEIRYLDANFPFCDGFPLLPHLSHSDGNKLDVSFFYKEKISGKKVNKKLSNSGYGIFEGPTPVEENRIKFCFNKGFKYYDYSKYFTFGSKNNNLVFDEEVTKEMIVLFANQAKIEKMFLEPHLVKRLNLDKVNKLRLHGCNAVRHDDHLHVQTVK